MVKTCLWRKNWAKAKSTAEAIVASNEYSLTQEYADIFTEDGENNAESVFEIQYMNASGGNWGKNNANEGSFTNVFQRARGRFAGFGLTFLPTKFYGSFLKKALKIHV
ncbi:MAG: hypothetical protein IPH94_16010 [Saprospiraceae bacterium]|nr:hypothetical protein [Saprospiraceae bacterium]